MQYDSRNNIQICAGEPLLCYKHLSGPVHWHVCANKGHRRLEEPDQLLSSVKESQYCSRGLSLDSKMTQRSYSDLYICT